MTMRPVEDFLPKAASEVQKAVTAGEDVQNLLDKYAEVLGEGIEDFHDRVAKVVEAEKAESLVRFIERRKAGQANENSSKEPGIVIYIRSSELVEKMQEWKTNDGYDIPTVEELENGIFRVEFSEGTYSMGMGRCQIFIKYDEELQPEQRQPFNAGYNSILRIEGISNTTLWQNVSYNWDGTPKSK